VRTGFAVRGQSLQKGAEAFIIIPMSSRPRKDNDTHAQVAVNKKAYANFELVDRFEAGMELVGSEVKSLREGQADLSGSYARIAEGQCFLVGAKIAAYRQAGLANHDPDRKRKLLLHRQEIRRLSTKLDQRGFTLVPLRIYFNDRGFAKVELALARGKRQYDKRRAITERELKKDIDRGTKKYRR
jgi:SsrA-binding protein